MSHRDLTKDPIDSRRHAYEKLETGGAAQEAIFEAFQTLANQGFVLGDKMEDVLSRRQAIKASRPKSH